MSATTTPTTSWASRHKAGLFLGCTMAVFVTGAGSLAGALLGGEDPAAVQAEQIRQLSTRYESADAELRAAHSELINQMGTLDAERTDTEDETARALLLSLTHTSTSAGELGRQQAVLQKLDPVWQENLQPLTGFLPDWKQATSAQGRRPYTLTSFDADVVQVKGLSYSYSALARLDTAVTQGPQAAQFVVMTYTTGADHTISDVEVELVSPTSRLALIEQAQTSSQSSGSASPSPSPSATPSPTDTATVKVPTIEATPSTASPSASAGG